MILVYCLRGQDVSRRNVYDPNRQSSLESKLCVSFISSFELSNYNSLLKSISICIDESFKYFSRRFSFSLNIDPFYWNWNGYVYNKKTKNLRRSDFWLPLVWWIFKKDAAVILPVCHTSYPKESVSHRSQDATKISFCWSMSVYTSGIGI